MLVLLGLRTVSLARSMQTCVNSRDEDGSSLKRKMFTQVSPCMETAAWAQPRICAR